MVTTNQTNKAKPAGARMQAEAELKARTEEKVRCVDERPDELLVAGIGTWDWDLVKNAAICSELYFRLCGLEPTESSVTTFEEWKLCIHPLDRDRAVGKALAARDTDETYEDEYRVVWPDGTIHWLAGRGRVLRDETGKPTRMLGVIIDITERKQAEAKHRRLATIVIDSNDAVTVQDFEGRLTAWNRGAAQMYGYSETEALTMNIRDIVPQDRFDDALDYLERIARGENVESLETRRRNKDGRTLDVWLTVTKLVDDDGKPVGVATTERDITERKQLERQFVELAEQERQRIGRELHDTTGQELTGLGFIAQSLLEQLAAEPHPAEETVRKMEEGIQRALAQVRRFAQGLVPVELDARGLMAALQKLATDTTADRNIHCTFRGNHLVSMEDNTLATQMYLIAKEAVANAVKHAQAEHVEIELSREYSGVTLLVRDDGVGISEPSDRDGMGLRVMRYRAALVQAKLEIESVDKGGTRVICVVTA